MKKKKSIKNFYIKSKKLIRRFYFSLLVVLSIFSSWIVLFYGFFVWIGIYIINILTSKLPLESNHYEGPSTYTYKIAEKNNLKLDIWYPKNFKPNYPVIFFSHGGGWISGFRNQPNNVSWCKYLASQGFAIVSVDYRFGFSNKMMDILSDYSDALDFIRSNSKELRLNTKKITLMGLSAGGHLALLYSSFYSFLKNKEKMEGIKSVVAYYTPTDLTDLLDKENKSLFAKFSVITTMKGTNKDKEDEYIYFSPMHWFSKNMVPVLFVHGKEDEVVPFNSSVKSIRKLKEYNVPFEFLVHKNGGHTFEFQLKDFQTIKIINKTTSFIKRMNENEKKY
ncbi:alpha/beta hydrolase [Oceanotoga sp. DSM 15011]|jgi:acetyl esterase/lipase|uniref:Acetyl esterase/lipase n=1 Tax=Oceanotoga teriensis TaxID=515440 RepID=A0AA45C9B9_9BACT|nr:MULTISPECIES: alpha/beta hydrolase [Oceanotoga]MDN5342950.1 hypothetical protein [Oceanotoga sp.]MDO7975319.1 alpha/beta hydrolase [Oceanotoga teriensis]PWJ96651.1 acetyl esterase/lipase [Oceanotoga teriensis]UYP00178.1 alpha/beta hydrolase [Oceanotoga sp. DSM 15011]